MGDISPPLQSLIDAALGAEASHLRVIVTLERAADWEKGVNQVAEAGLHITGQEEALRLLFGRASPEVIRRIAALPAVARVEADEQATALR